MFVPCWGLNIFYVFRIEASENHFAAEKSKNLTAPPIPSFVSYYFNSERIVVIVLDKFYCAMPLSTSSTYPGTWHLQYSSRNIWIGKRNAHASFTTSNSLSYTYQDHHSLEIKSRDEKVLKVVATGKDGKLESWMTEVDGGIVGPSRVPIQEEVRRLMKGKLNLERTMLTLLLNEGEYEQIGDRIG